MVYRNSWLAGLAALAFAFAKLNGLILPSETGVQWQYMAVAALALGIVITWTALTYRLKTWLVMVINFGAALVAVTRVATPETTAFLLSTRQSMVTLAEVLTVAQGRIRTGVEPVVPIVGVVVVVMLVLWASGALLSWGLLRGHPYVALLPPLVLALQFTTMDRLPTSGATIAAFVALVALVIFAITSDERDHTAGRMAPRGEWAPRRHRPGPAASMFLVATMAIPVVAVGAADGAVPYDGYLDWRVNSPAPLPNFGSYGTSDSYNPFIGIHQQLVSNGRTVRFMAGIQSEIPRDEVYFQFVTMEDYDGSKFSAASRDLGQLEDEIWELPGHSFAGPTTELATIVAIDRLRMPWLPVPATPWAVQGISHEFDPYLRVRPEDGSILYQGGETAQDMQYRVDASIAEPDISVLATKPGTTELSIVFRTAMEEGDLAAGITPLTVPAPLRLEPPEPERFLNLPADATDARISEIRSLATRQTQGLETEFERGLALEAWLRTFRYTTDIVPDQAADDLAAWLLDEDSNNFRAGYCENFATAMAVMARTLGIHSRVVLGFTPGDPHPLQPGVVVVRDRNAHAWVELWMPTQGWVRFDPTPRPDSVNPSTTAMIEAELELGLDEYLDIEVPTLTPAAGSPEPVFLLEDFPEFFLGQGGGINPTPTPSQLPGWVRWAIPVLVVAALLAVGLPLLKRAQRRRRLDRLRAGDITAAWEEIVARLSDLGTPPRPTLTPLELAHSIDESMVPLAGVYGKAAYGPGNGVADASDVAAAEEAMTTTRERLDSKTTRRKRLIAAYRLGAAWRKKAH